MPNASVPFLAMINVAYRETWGGRGDLENCFVQVVVRSCCYRKKSMAAILLHAVRFLICES